MLANTLFDETKTSAIHLYQAWQLTTVEPIHGYFEAAGFTLDKSETLNHFSTLLTFSKFNLPVWMRLTNQTQIDIERFAADGFHLKDNLAKWQMDIAVPVDSVRLLNTIEQAVLSLTAEQPLGSARHIIVRPYQSIWCKLETAKKTKPYNGEKVQTFWAQLEQDGIRWLIKK